MLVNRDRHHRPSSLKVDPLISGQRDSFPSASGLPSSPSTDHTPATSARSGAGPDHPPVRSRRPSAPSSRQPPISTRAPAPRDRPANSVTSRDFPDPGLPATMTADGLPRLTLASALSSAESWLARPIRTGLDIRGSTSASVPVTPGTCPRRLFGPPTTDVRFCRSGQADKGEPERPLRLIPASPWPTPTSATTRSSATSRRPDHGDHTCFGLVTGFLPTRRPRVQPN